MWIGSPGATSGHPMASVHSKATGSGGVVGRGSGGAVGAAVGVAQAARIRPAMASTDNRAKVRFMVFSPPGISFKGRSLWVVNTGEVLEDRVLPGASLLPASAPSRAQVSLDWPSSPPKR